MWRQSRVLPGDDGTGMGTGRKKAILGAQDASEGPAEAPCMQLHHHGLGNPSQPVSETQRDWLSLHIPKLDMQKCFHSQRIVWSSQASSLETALEAFGMPTRELTTPQVSTLRKPHGWVSALPCLQLALPILCSAHLSYALEQLDSDRPGYQPLFFLTLQP